MEQLLSLISILQRAYGRQLLRHMLQYILMIIGLMILASLMLGAALIGSLYGAYIALISNGLPPQTALYCLIAAAAGIAGVLVCTIICILRRFHQQNPPSLLESTLGSFVDGLLQK